MIVQLALGLIFVIAAGVLVSMAAIEMIDSKSGDNNDDNDDNY